MRCVLPFRKPAACLAAILVAFTFGAARRGEPAAPQASSAPAEAAAVDALFSRWTSATPGCSVGVSHDGRPVLARAYGMADLEHDVPNTPETIFEAGSVSKQFTAAAILILAREHRLSLDDPVRKYLPELPDYGTRLTIRQMLTHTSGLRDWGSVASIGGWPRTTRAYTQAHVLDIARRQRALNFPPGTNWSYSNTGYNLAAIIVSRVAGTSFAEFCRTRLFQPLSMAHTSWRDDYTRIVKRRAIAYDETKDGLRADMPFENVHGNGGLLTTVGDLLRWNEHLDNPGPDDLALVRAQQEPARLASGQLLDYAFGLYVRTYKGVKEVGHSGSTAGYRAYLARYPERNLSVAVLCNAGSANAEKSAHAVADLYLGLAPTPPAAAAVRAQASPGARPGLYRNVATGQPLSIVRDGGSFRVEDGPSFVVISGGRLWLPEAGRTVDFSTPERPRVRLANGLEERFERVPRAKPTAAEFAPLTGWYTSDEAEVSYRVKVQDGQLVMWRRPDSTIVLKPLYADAFSAGSLGTVRFIRRAGKVAEMSVVSDRVWDLRLRRQ